MLKNNNEHEHSALQELTLGEKLRKEVKTTLDTLKTMGITKGATVSRFKGIFPNLTDREIDRVLGKSASRMGTTIIPKTDLVRIVVLSAHKSESGKKPFDKALKTAIREGSAEFEADNGKQRNKESEKYTHVGRKKEHKLTSLYRTTSAPVVVFDNRSR